MAAWLGYFPTQALRAETADDFFTQRGSDPTFAEIMKDGDLTPGKNSTTGVKGSTIRVKDALLKLSPDARRKIPEEIKIHTLGNSVINRSGFPNWTRWYQEDGNTQVFRLFKDEENVRNKRKLAARVEAFSKLSWGRGEWHEWVGTYTIIKPHGASIFQVMNSESEWAMHLTMGSSGNVAYNHRRGGGSKVIATNMAGKPFHIRVRDNGHDFELFLNGKSQGKGTYDRPQGKTNFRWGMYLGASEVSHDAMIFVTGAGIDVKNYKPEGAGALATETKVEEPVDKKKEEEPSAPSVEKGLAIPERVWTNDKGVAVRAVGLFAPGSDHVNLRVGGEWVVYPLVSLAEEDRKALVLALDFAE